MKDNTLEKDAVMIPCTLHPALIRPILLGGADRTLVLLNMTCIVMLIFGVGLHVLTICLALCFAIMGHSILLRVAKYDPEFSRIYLRHIKYNDFYPALSSALSRDKVPS
jgi:type IV secretory pathway TrbD component